MDVFMLWHIYEQRDGTGIHNEEKLIGVFSSTANAREAIERLKDKEGFRDLPQCCFEIHKTEMDRISWEDGFTTIRWREAEP